MKGRPVSDPEVVQTPHQAGCRDLGPTILINIIARTVTYYVLVRAAQMVACANPGIPSRRLGRCAACSTGRAAAIRQHVLEMPAPVVADALGYHPVTTAKLAVQAGGTWSRYATGDHLRSPSSWTPRRTHDS